MAGKSGNPNGWAHRWRPAGYFSAGDGWGGPAKGSRDLGPPRAFTKDDPNQVRYTAEKRPDMSEEAVQRRKVLADAEEERQKQMRDHIGDLALNAAREETQLSAAIAYLNRSEGLPVARSVNQNTEVPFEELVKQIGSVTKPK